jgi:hypothetical protein
MGSPAASALVQPMGAQRVAAEVELGAALGHPARAAAAADEQLEQLARALLHHEHVAIAAALHLRGASSGMGNGPGSLSSP